MCQNARISVFGATSVARYVLNSCSIVWTPLIRCVMSIVGRLKRDVSKQDWLTTCQGGGGGVHLLPGSASYNLPSVQNQHTEQQAIIVNNIPFPQSPGVLQSYPHCSSVAWSMWAGWLGSQLLTSKMIHISIELDWLTHCYDICASISHALVVLLCAFKASLNKGRTVWNQPAQSVPLNNKHFKHRDCCAKQWSAFARHSMLYTMRNLRS